MHAKSSSLGTASPSATDLAIQEVEILRLTGPRQVTRGVHRQHQVQPGHLYPDRRPAAYRDATDAKPETVSLTQYSPASDCDPARSPPA